MIFCENGHPLKEIVTSGLDARYTCDDCGEDMTTQPEEEDMLVLCDACDYSRCWSCIKFRYSGCIQTVKEDAAELEDLP